MNSISPNTSFEFTPVAWTEQIMFTDKFDKLTYYLASSRLGSGIACGEISEPTSVVVMKLWYCLLLRRKWRDEFDSDNK